MADRALHLARTLLTRIATLDAEVREEGARDADRHRRVGVVEKVLAVEFGITDSATISLVESAIPHLKTEARIPEREAAELADFLRKHLHRPLTEP